MLSSSSEVIDALGGTQVVTSLLGVGPSAVSNYRSKGFPARAALILARQCEQRGLAVAPQVFGVALTDPDKNWRRQSAYGADQVFLAKLAERGYTPCNTPILQPADPFIDLLGEEVRRRLFSFVDPRGETLCLRPDLTIPTARAFIEAGDFSCKHICYQGTAFRYQPRGAGKPEEFTQIGLEILNGNDSLADELTIFGQVADLLADARLKHYDIYINDLALFSAALLDLNLPPRQQAQLMRAYAHGSAFETTLKTLQQNKPILPRSMPETSPKVIVGRNRDEIQSRYLDKLARAQSEPLSAKTATTLLTLGNMSCPAHALERTIAQLDLPIGKNLSAVLKTYSRRLEALSQKVDAGKISFAATRGRKLAYYTGFAFEMVISRLGPRQIIASGGRYDALLSALGAPSPMPAVGAALALERIQEAGETSS